MQHTDGPDDCADVLSSIDTLLRCVNDPLEQEEAPDDLMVGEKRIKKHSGPRKRRPKKKPANGKITVAPSPPPPGPLCVDTGNTTIPKEEDAVHLKSLRASAAPFVPMSPPVVHPTGLDFEPLATDLSLSLESPVEYPHGFSFRPASLLLSTDASEAEQQQHDRLYWTQYVIDAAEKERERRLSVLRQMQREEEEEIRRRRAWAIDAIEKEQQAMMREMFLDNMKNTQWFQSTITSFDHDYEVVCPNSWFGCTYSCMLKDLEAHVEHCVYRQVPDTLDQVDDQSVTMDLYSYDVVCPNAMLGCSAIFPREELPKHLASCPVSSMTREQEWQERQEWQQNVIEMTEEERQRRMDEHRGQRDRFSFSHLQRLYEEQTSMMHVVLHEEIVAFTNQCDADAERIRPAIEVAIARIGRVIHDIWGEDVHVESYGSFATRLHGGHSDVDLVVFGATVVAEDPAKSVTSQDCVSMLAVRLSGEQAGMYDSISAITRASIPLVKVVMTVVMETGDGSSETFKIPFDVTFDDPRDTIHNGVASASLLETLLVEFYGLRELTLVLKHFLATRGLNDPYVGGLSSYGLVLMIIFVLREQGALVKPAKPTDSYRSANDTLSSQEESTGATKEPLSRYEAQKIKGVTVAKEIIRQARARQSMLFAAAMAEPIAINRRSGAAAWEVLMQDGQPSSNRASPHKVRSTEPFLLGKLLMDFLQWYGTDFRHTFDQISVLSTADASASKEKAGVASPNMPKAASPSLNHRPTAVNLSPLFQPSSHEASLMIQDPLQSHNNVGKTCYRISQVLRDFSDFLSVLTALIVRGRVMVPGTPTIPGIDTSREITNGKRARSSSSQRILSCVFQMKQVNVVTPSSTRGPTNGPTSEEVVKQSLSSGRIAFTGTTPSDESASHHPPS